jgi:hypothetical protein
VEIYFRGKIGKISGFLMTHRLLESLVLCLPIILFMLPMLLTGSRITPGDPDYVFHLAEAGRKSILIYHQFPWWDPWLSGGIPLFGSVVYGLVSIQTPFTLLFGAVMGWKIAIVAYQLVGFFGFRKLFRDVFNTERWRAVLLAYIPMLGGFFIHRTISGHSPFLLIAFVPWLLVFFLQRARKRSWLWFALVLSFMVWTSPHYITIMAVLVIVLWYIFELAGQLVSARRAGKVFKREILAVDIRFFIKAFALTGLLCAYRMLYVVSFIKDFPRPEPLNSDPYTGVIKGLQALWGPNPYTHPLHLSNGWGWEEASSYIGIGSLVAVGLIGIACFMRYRGKDRARGSLFSYPPLILLLLFISFFLLGMGHFGRFSPYALLHGMPVFGSMRVATRWLMWSSLTVLFLIAAYKGKRFGKLINLSLLAVIIELFTTVVQQYRDPKAPFTQGYHYRLPRPLYANDKNYQKAYFYDENLYESTLNNFGQVIAGDPLVDTRQAGSTIRCGLPEGQCDFISSNAKIVYWSPDKMVIKRLAPGPINIDMNPGRGWKVNGKYIFIGYKVTDPLRSFVINDPSSSITVEYIPKYSIEWLFNKL